ncbi:MAG TPA: CoA transferase, partial [Burkholderiaceae bacterium]|nr:CoA transferase [Burkholderiaceae bacterium]
TALQGMRVLDLGQWIAAPYCTALLADFGAEVIKLEKPQGGDDQRQSSPFIGGQSAFFNLFNRNKRSVTIDLSTDSGRGQCLDLIATADVLVENYRPGSMARMGLGYEDLKERFPRLIYCSISGFGQTGPLKSEGGFDLVIQAMSGLASICGPADGQPFRLPIPIVDVSTALFATIGILTAAAARERTGEGQYVDVALLDSALAMAPLEVAQLLATGVNPERMGQASRNAAPYQIFATQRGSIALGAAAQHLWKRTCEVLGCAELLTDERFITNADRIENREELAAIIEQALAAAPADYWLERLLQEGIPAGPVLTYEEVMKLPQLESRALVRKPENGSSDAPATMVAPIQLSSTPARLISQAPLLGEHTQAVLDELYGAHRAT